MSTASMSPKVLRTITLRTGTTASALVCGICAVIAFIFGSPLDFGIALAACGAWCIAADFLRWQPRAEHSTGRRATPMTRPGPGTGHVVFLGAGQVESCAEAASDADTVIGLAA